MFLYILPSKAQTVTLQFRISTITDYQDNDFSDCRNVEISRYRHIEISTSRNNATGPLSLTVSLPPSLLLPSTPLPPHEEAPASLRTSGLSQQKWRLPTLPRVCSTIGASGLNFSVRDGKRWDPAAITALNKFQDRGPTAQSLCRVTCLRKDRKATDSPKRTSSQSIRAISTARL